MNQTYIIQPGDTLWAIAEQFYGDGNEWQRIYDANRHVIGSNPDEIYPGQEIVLP